MPSAIPPAPALLLHVLSAVLLPQPTHQQQQQLPTPPAQMMCLDAGLYYSPVSNKCEPCPAGSYCLEGSSAYSLCPAGQFQQQGQQSACIDCPENHDCSAAGTVSPVACPLGRVSPAGSSLSCSQMDCDYENYYYNATAKLCVNRTVFCNLQTHYEVPTPLNYTQERICKPLSVCKTVRLKDRSPIDGGPSGVALFDPLQEYIVLYSSRYLDRKCWAWAPCGPNDYVEQLPVDDGVGFLVKPQVCKGLSKQSSARGQYLLVDGSATRCVCVFSVLHAFSDP